MKLFQVKENVSGILMSKGGARCRWHTREDTTFTREELVMDPIKRHNSDMYRFCKELEQRDFSNKTINAILNEPGMMVFERPGMVLFFEQGDVCVL